MIADLLILVAAGLVGYGLLVAFAAEYGRRTGWTPPEGTDANDWSKRQKIGLALGAIAMLVCGVLCAVFVAEWLPRALILAQAAVMAAAGASDLRRFHLPLPLSLLGLVLAIVSLSVLQVQPILLVFGAAWAVAVIALHALFSRGSMQLGDHIATVWIALAMPFNGLLAVILGDFANVIFAKLQGLRGKKVAAAGSWLIFAAALMSLPPYFAVFGRNARESGGNVATATTVIDSSAINSASASASTSVRAAQQAGVRAAHWARQAAQTANPNRVSLIAMLNIAGDATARVALEGTRENRVARAVESARVVSQLAAFAQLAGADGDTVVSLQQLSHALANYDLAGVRASTARIAAARDTLTGASN